jgi:flavin reductase (DIM6/NTAB) family NADH-FMN oxidoreductase RutF
VTRIDPDELDGSLYRTLAGAVIPRPITWVSSLSRGGGDENLAPYSFFNVRKSLCDFRANQNP